MVDRMRTTWKRWMWAREQRHCEYLAFIVGSPVQWHRVKEVNNVTGVWKDKWTW